MDKKRYIAPGGWFALYYPERWSEFEDEEGSFLFYDPAYPPTRTVPPLMPGSLLPTNCVRMTRHV